MGKAALEEIFALINEKEDQEKVAEQTKTAEEQMVEEILEEAQLTDAEKEALLTASETETEEKAEEKTEEKTEEVKEEEKTASEAEEKRAEELGRIMGKVAGEEFIKTIEGLLEKESAEGVSKVSPEVEKGTGEGPSMKEKGPSDKGGPVDKIKAKLDNLPSAPVKSNALVDAVKKVIQTAKETEKKPVDNPHD